MQGSRQLRCEVSWCSLTLLSGTTSFPSEEAAAKAAAVPILRVYIFFTKSSGVVNLFFKTQRGKEPCIICKQCIIGYVVQSLLYSGLSCSCPPKKMSIDSPPPAHSQALCPTPSIPHRQGPLSIYSSLLLLMCPSLPAAALPPDPSQQPCHSSSHHLPQTLGPAGPVSAAAHP